MNQYQYCLYYQAHIPRERCGIFVALVRSFEHVCFDRTFDVATSTFEFFVPHHQRQEFLELMQLCEHEKLVERLTELPHRMR